MYIYIYMYMCIHSYVYLCKYVYIHMYIYMHIYLYRHKYITHIYLNLYVDIFCIHVLLRIVISHVSHNAEIFQFRRRL